MFERPGGGERAVLVNIHFRHGDNNTIAEFAELARAAGVEEVARVELQRNTVDAKTFIGSGKAKEIGELCQQHEADVVLFNHSLSPAQERNLERQFNTAVLDRIGVILDIFAQRASTFEGKLQVELAQLRHLSTRLIRGWTHLERQKGGIGLRGPGETQLETDRRLIGERIRQINRRLDKVQNQRDQARRARRRAELPVVSLVGYTNAGKSTLFNRLSGAQVFAADQLFATLDPTLRRIERSGHCPWILADTVGFIRQLPHDLIAAFRATLEETRQADLLLHVIDASDPQREEQIAQVDEVLDSIGAGAIPRLRVFNKIDRMQAVSACIERDGSGIALRAWVSAASGEGLEALQAVIEESCQNRQNEYQLQLPAQAGRLRAALYQHQAVRAEQLSEQGGWTLSVALTESRLRHLCKREGLEPGQICKEAYTPVRRS